MITKFGKRFLSNYLAGNVGFSGKEIALGIGESSETDLSTRLDFEFFRFAVEFGSIDIETNETASAITARDGETTIQPGDTLYSVIYKSTIPQEVSGVIKEIGIYPNSGLSSNKFTGKIVSLFDDVFSWNLVGGSGNPESTPTSNSYTALVGNSTSKITNDGISTSIEYKASIPISDFSGYTAADTLVLSYIKADTNLSKIKIKLYSDDSSYYYVEYSSTSGTIEDGGTWASLGNKIHSVTLENLVNQYSGTPSLSNIIAIGISVECSSLASPATVYLDALRINDEDTFDPINGMISRSVLATEIVKTAGQQLDIEYRIGLSF